MSKQKNYPDKRGYYGDFGGRYVPETLMAPLEELKGAYQAAMKDPAFRRKVGYYLAEYAGRPTPLYFAEKLSKKIGGARIFLKREDLLHTGAHKINNTLGQVLLAKRMKKTRVIAETGAGQHGVATATACALLDLKCVIYMGEEDIHRQAINVSKMRLLGARVISVVSGSNTLKDAMNEAIRDWVTNVKDTFYVIGSVAGPHPYPQMVRDFQRVIGRELKRQFVKKEGRFPDYLVACVGGGSNAMGLFYDFLKNKSVKMIGVEAAGLGLQTTKHAATLAKGSVGVLHGSKSYVLQTDDGQIREVHSVSAGLDYPGVGPEHAFLKTSGRVKYVTVTDAEALQGVRLLSREEGIIPALESSHALIYAAKLAGTLSRKTTIVVCCSGRGDKDMSIIGQHMTYGD